MTPTAALEQFGLLTVGDGLVAQIPSIVLAVSAGILVTRVGSDGEQQSLGADLASQLLGNARALYVAGGFVLLLGLIPGLPNFAFFVVGASLILGAFARHQKLSSRESEKQRAFARVSEAKRFIPMLEPWAIRLGAGYLSDSALRKPNLTGKEVPELAALVESLRATLFRELGVQIPACRFEYAVDLKPSELTVELREITILRHISTSSEAPRIDELAKPLHQLLRRNAGRFLGLSGTQALLDALEQVDSVSVRQVIPRLVTLPQLNEILLRLIEEGVSIRDLSAILAALGRVAQNEKDPYRLAELVREAQKDALLYQLSQGSGRLRVIVLDPTLEDMIRMAISKNGLGQNLSMSASALKDVLLAITRAFEEATVTGSGAPQAILVAPEIRRHLRKVIESVLPDVAVLSYSELLPELILETQATASLFGIDTD
jgi:type III secretory pathway component EscV